MLNRAVQTSLHAPDTQKPSLRSAVQKLTGTLWYEMLSELNKTGFSEETLGPGGGDFQSMFLWNLSQTGFGNSDSRLVDAAMRQVGGHASAEPEPPPAATQLSLRAAAANIGAQALPESDAAAPAGDLVSQATSFARSIWPQITAAASQLGVPPIAVLAQTALETGWGAAAPGHNLFGIKASGAETGTARATHEMVDGVLTPQTANFRNYDDNAGSVSDYVGLIQSFYQNVTGQGSVAGFARALQSGGYATDPNYAAKIEQIAQSPLMAQVLQAVGGATLSTNSGGQP